MEPELEPRLFLAASSAMGKERGETRGLPEGKARAHTESYQAQSDE